MGEPAEGEYAQIEAEKEDVVLVLLGVVERKTLLPVLSGKGKFTK